MKTVNDFQECLEYVNRLGIVSRSKPIHWRQANLCQVVEGIEELAGGRGAYPFKATFCRAATRAAN
jgi:hypothetical protein